MTRVSVPQVTVVVRRVGFSVRVELSEDNISCAKAPKMKLTEKIISRNILFKRGIFLNVKVLRRYSKVGYNG
jgi:hypothetical protein